LGLLTCKNRFPYNLYCVGGDVKHCTIQSSCRPNIYADKTGMAIVKAYPDVEGSEHGDISSDVGAGTSDGVQ